METRAGNSRFVTTVTRADSVRAAQAFLRRIRAELPDANHHVYAYRVGFGASVSEGMSDDGEPSGTSGPPTLAVVRGANIGDIALVTARYFGGTKLGTGGLVSAYTAAAQAGIASVATEEKVARVERLLTIPYALHETMKRMLGEHEARLLGEEFGAEVSLRLDVPEECEASLARAVSEASAGRCRLDPVGGDG